MVTRAPAIIVMLRACVMSVLFHTGTFHFCPTQLCLLFSPPSVFPLQPSDIIHYFLTVCLFAARLSQSLLCRLNNENQSTLQY